MNMKKEEINSTAIDRSLYQMIFKRKSFHLFRFTGNEEISQDELLLIKERFQTFAPLDETIKTDIQILPADHTSCKRGEEYCILFYSEKKNNHLQNIGYLGEQLDLFLASIGIGALWFGIGKTLEANYNNLDFVIMMAIKKVPADSFRKDMFKSKRKSAEEIWSGTPIEQVTDLIRFAPSACNTQPWYVEHHKQTISVYRDKKAGKRGIMPADKVSYYNRIDIGIFLLFLELCLDHETTPYSRALFGDDDGDAEKKLIATYQLQENE